MFPPAGVGPVNVDGIGVFYDDVPFGRRWGFSPAMVRRLRAEVPAADLVLVHFHYQFASAAAGRIARMCRRPYVVFTHGSLNRTALDRHRGGLKRAYLAVFERANFKGALFSAYQSREELDRSLRWGVARIVPNGIDMTAMTLPPRGAFRNRRLGIGEAPLCLFLGRVDPGKGLDLLIPAFRRVLDHRPDAHLVIAGADERGYARHVAAMIRAAGVGAHVSLVGLLDDDEKAAALSDADVFVLPSRHEGMSLALLEAMAAALPVVVTEGVGLAQRIQAQQCGVVVPLESDALSAALVSVMRSPDRHAMGERGKALIESEYSWDTIADRLVREVREAL